MTAFIDAPRDRFELEAANWSKVTEMELSSWRGTDSEFATFVPAEGDAFLRFQRVGGPARIHLDVHVDDPRAASARSVELGATQVADHGYRVMRSPTGFTFCWVPAHSDQKRPLPTSHGSLVDQVCLDVDPDGFAAEVDFWAAVTGWEPRQSPFPQFVSITGADSMPIRLLVQRRDDPSGATTAHLDLAATDYEAEAIRHERLGARVVRRGAMWTTLRDPAGLDYCVTGRPPALGPR